MKRLETDYRQLELDSKALVETIEHMGDRIRERNETLASLRSTVEERTRERNAAQDALRIILRGEGRYSMDPLTHASNTIEDMRDVAMRALAAARPTPAGEPPHQERTET